MKPISLKTIFRGIALGILLIIGLVIRLDDLHEWQSRPEYTFSAGETLLATGDGYYYLRLTRDLRDGTYHPTDEKRGVPDNPPRPAVPPLLSQITAFVSSISGWSLNRTAIILPAILGVLLAIPLYGIGRLLGGPLMGLTSAGLGLLSNSYYVRSTIGKYDTDCLNVTITLTAVWFFMLFAKEKSYRRYVFFAAGLLCWLFFIFWWDQAPHIATLIAFWPALIALVFSYRPSKKEGFAFGLVIAILVFIAIAFLGVNFPLQIFHSVQGHLGYLLKKPVDSFPSIGLFISEQQKYDLKTIIGISTNSTFVFWVAIAGLFWLCYRRTREMLFLLVPLLLAVLSSFYASRFLIYQAPVISFGLGFFISEIYNRFQKYRITYLIIAAFLCFAGYRCLISNRPAVPLISAASINGMQAARTGTQENGVIWSWCDNGYPIIYWADRATICDGQLHSGELSVYAALPLAADNPQLAANFMNFFIHRGQKGIREFYRAMNNNGGPALREIKMILAAGPEKARSIIARANPAPVGAKQTVEDWLHFFYPAADRPLYLFIDYSQIEISLWIAWLGSWDPEMRDGFHPLPMRISHELHLEGMQVSSRNGRFRADFNLGKAWYRDIVVPFASGALTVSGHTVLYDFGERFVETEDILGNKLRQYGLSPAQVPLLRGQYHLEVSKPADTGMLMSREVAASLMHKLFWRGKAVGSPYFSLILDRSPAYQLWEARPDTISSAK